MKNKVILIILILLFASFACGVLSSSDSGSSTDTPECNPEKWKITITAIEQHDLGNGTKLIVTRIGIENHDMVWGSVKGPSTISNEAQNAIYLTTKDGSKYNYLRGFLPVPSPQLSDQDQTTYESTGWIGTVPLPPGFAVLGPTVQGRPYMFNFAFQIPLSQEPETINISGLEVECIFPHTIQENGKASYGGGHYDLPETTYNLPSEIHDIHSQPSNNKHPNLVGSKIELPNHEGALEFTDVSREGKMIVVTFNFTNLSSAEASPQFNGYILSNSGFYSCLTTSENDCEHQSFYTPVQPGQTAQGLTWSFAVPQDSTDLFFVYVYGDVIDVNEVYRIAPK
jgi:hypothetical protein